MGSTSNFVEVADCHYQPPHPDGFSDFHQILKSKGFGQFWVDSLSGHEANEAATNEEDGFENSQPHKFVGILKPLFLSSVTFGGCSHVIGVSSHATKSWTEVEMAPRCSGLNFEMQFALSPRMTFSSRGSSEQDLLYLCVTADSQKLHLVFVGFVDISVVCIFEFAASWKRLRRSMLLRHKFLMQYVCLMTALVTHKCSKGVREGQRPKTAPARRRVPRGGPGHQDQPLVFIMVARSIVQIRRT